MRLYYDLHMHSALSPCGDDENTPNNLVHMAMLKELDLIAITDHNSAFNLPAAAKVAQACDLLLLPGLEITTAEEVHLLAYFPRVEQAVEFGAFIYESLPDVKNREEIFGHQYIMDEQDEIIGSLDKLLINACPYSYEYLVKEIQKNGGVPVPAHVNKSSNSLLANLGFIPEDVGVSCLEIWRQASLDGVDVERYRLLSSSDAHTFLDIAERENYLNCETKSVQAVLEKLSTPG